MSTAERGKGTRDLGGPGAEPPGPPPVAPAVVALRMEDVTHWMIERVSKMPRAHKFTLGDKLVETCLEVTCALVDAAYTRDKLGLLAQASRQLTRSRVLARLAHRSRLLSHDQLLHFEHETVEVGRMLGGWTRSVRRR
jgi:hypothetical protein